MTEPGTGPLIPLAPGEEGRWTGTPGLAPLTRMARFQGLKGLVGATFVVLLLALVYRSGLGAGVKMLLAVVAVPAFIIAAMMMAVPLMARRIGRNTRYAVTNQRVFVSSGFGSVSTTWFWLRDLTGAEMIREPDGTHTITILTAKTRQLLHGIQDGEKVLAIIRAGMTKPS
ncbi:MAG TPA: hypothetical protein VGQ83_35135 [Polyangia bacterium]|jgi:hypothetical protein